MIIAEECENISITGKGKIAGNFKSVFDLTQTDERWRPHYPRPEWRMAQMIFLAACRNVIVKDVTLCDSQYWTCFLLDCDEGEITGVKIRCDRMVINADGLDIDCCRNVNIINCDIDCGDDCIALRANERHALRNSPCDNIVVENCQLRSPACAVRVGVGNGTLRNCHLKNLKIYYPQEVSLRKSLKRKCRKGQIEVLKCPRISLRDKVLMILILVATFFMNHFDKDAKTSGGGRI